MSARDSRDLVGQGASPAARPKDATPDVGVIIVAAGSGTRTGSQELKQFRWIAGKPMLLHSVQTFQARKDVALVVCVLPHQYAGDPPPWLFQSDLNRLLISVGGKTRSESVANGLQDLTPEVKYVLVHDAARPFVDDATIDRVITEARKGHGAIAALPVVDTLKRVDANGQITETVDRANLYRAQTPQGFPREMIEAAYKGNPTATDDAALCESLGYKVVVVPGSERAMKITEEADFPRAECVSHRH